MFMDLQTGETILRGVMYTMMMLFRKFIGGLG